MSDIKEIEKYSKEWFDQNPDVSITDVVHSEEKYIRPLEEVAQELHEIYTEFKNESDEENKMGKFCVLLSVIVNMDLSIAIPAYFWIFDKERETIDKMYENGGHSRTGGYNVEHLDKMLSFVTYIKASERKLILNKHVEEMLFDLIRYQYKTICKLMDSLETANLTEV